MTQQTPSTLEKNSTTTIPRLNLHPSHHKLAITLRFAILFTTGCVVQESVYFALRYHTTLKLTYILAIVGSVFGLPSFLTFFQRLYRLAQKSPQYRPLGCEAKRAGLDFFHWNYLFGIVYITAVITTGISLTDSSVGMVSMPLALLMLHVCSEMLLCQIFRAAGIRTFIRTSSVPRGAPFPSAVSVIVEDIVAVDAGQGLEFRAAWQGRIAASPAFGKMLHRLDLLWGVSGVGVAVGILAVIWAVPDRSVGFGVGWGVPWVWVVCLSGITYVVVKAALREERRMGYRLL